VTHTAGATTHTVKRPDGAELHWEMKGEGPLVVLAHHTLWSHPAVYAGLVDELASDHEVVLYDPRGCGGSTARGPYDLETDAADLAGVAEAAGGGALTIAVGNGFNRTARVGASQPDLISRVIAIAPSAAAILPRAELKGSDVLAASESVAELVLQMMETDPRGALRTMIAATNPGLDEEQVRKRVETVAGYLDLDGESERARAWLSDDVREQVRILGDRVWILHGGDDPLFEGVLGARVAELFPDAHLQQVADGPVSRPDITAGWVRQVSRAATAGR